MASLVAKTADIDLLAMQLPEKNLSGSQRHNKHDSKHQRHQPYAAAPPKNCTAAVRPPLAEKPATQSEETEPQHHDVSNPYRHRLT